MSVFLDILMSYPTVVFTVLLGVAVFYWLLVILGAVDLDALDPSGLFHGVDGALDGAAHGVAEGAAEAAGGAIEGALHGAADGAAEGAGHALDGHDVDMHHVGETAGLLSALGLRGVPITIIASVTLAFAWVLCGMSTEMLQRVLPTNWWEGGLQWIVGTVIALASFIVGLLGSAIALRPLRFAVRTKQGRSRHSLVGLTAVVTTQRVDDKFGQAEAHVDGDYILVDVRCDEENELHKGSLVLLYDHDTKEELFRVVPHDQA